MSIENSYWNGKGRYQEQAEFLMRIMPAHGKAPKSEVALNHARAAFNAYNDLYTTGLSRSRREFRRWFKLAPRNYSIDLYTFTDELYQLVEERMDQYILAAYNEQIQRVKE